MDLSHSIESILFVSPKPLSIKKLAAILEVKQKDIEVALTTIAAVYANRGIQLVWHEDTVQFTSHPECAERIREYLKEDSTGELTRPALETLSVIAYRGPVTKTDIEQIRGVNCSLSLRNLLIRGLIEVSEGKAAEKHYILTFDFLNHLGVQNIHTLPDYESLNASKQVEELLQPPIDSNTDGHAM